MCLENNFRFTYKHEVCAIIYAVYTHVQKLRLLNTQKRLFGHFDSLKKNSSTIDQQT